MGYRNFSRESFAGTKAKVDAAAGDTSYAGRQEIKKTGKLHPLVDPAGYGLIRRSLPRYVELPDGRFHNVAGIPMPVETLFDTTGSMGGNVELAFRSLPTLYDLLASGKMPVLGRYDPQLANAIFGDVVDDFILSRSQFEMDEKTAEQLTLMVPERSGGDSEEDPEYGLFGAAFLTDAFIVRYGFKSYHSMVTDATSHGHIDKKNLVRVFGDTVFDQVKENGYTIDPKNLPDTVDIVRELKKRTHAFMISVGRGCANYWSRYYDAERVVVVDSTAHLAYVQAALIGLTEDVYDLQSLPDQLVQSGCDRHVARDIQRAVAGIPIGEQKQAKHWKELPGKGGVYAQKQDLWPVADGAEATTAHAAEDKWL